MGKKIWIPAFGFPVVLSGLFYALRDEPHLMDSWVQHVLSPVIQTMGKFWSLFPFSVAELLAAVFMTGSVIWVLRAVVMLFKERSGRALLKRLGAFFCVLAWLWTIFCWSWNCTYAAPSFAEKNGLSKAPYTPEKLLAVTLYFAQMTAALSTQVPRNEDLSFDLTLEECFQRGKSVYDNLSEIYPDLTLSHRQAKPLVCSRLQSYMGYTGIYFPFTGEANVNVDQARCLVPSTIAHEMAHQRLIASEDECNFLGILACLTSDDVVYQYSGYMMGLVYLTNALRDLSPELVQEIMRQFFTPELTKDWSDNYNHWHDLKSPTRDKVNEAVDQVYDGYLKGNGQVMGLMSYSACVDLLVNYFG